MVGEYFLLRPSDTLILKEQVQSMEGLGHDEILGLFRDAELGRIIRVSKELAHQLPPG